ncbi:pyridoxal-phosphate dependent enzyme [Streptomyces sp. PTM05]|uniref:Pyridoxal-phosphate dependent enzyme n=1 Tax=Streptantibioticus parmotrematis TaxID=2873249 RepID=A0ABS7QYB2_9ACTN|nr:pyridoxal-phosphate dependent enzyme [Streptantibioticus parmotrematis]MBY8888207.1 pyridoxal-phosphate dependent enzyme [Streptantibioticus parmotrematis]
MRPTADLLAALEERPPSPLQGVHDDALTRRGVRLLLKRDDLVHPDLPGNKWRKLRLNLAAVLESGGGALLTFGGAYSNHLRATAAAGRMLGLDTIGVVRGDELASRPLNASLARAADDGMRLHFVTRADYRRKTDPAFLAGLEKRFGDFHLVPEGGSNALAVLGCVDLGRELRGHADVVAVACGTGGTLAGLAAGLDPADQRVIGFPVLKGGGFLADDIARLQTEAFGGPRGDWSLDTRFHCGGYARVPPRLRSFAEEFGQQHGLTPDLTYVAKMLLGVRTLAEEGAFAPGTRVAAVITG